MKNMRKNKAFISQIQFEQTLKTLNNQISYIPEDELQYTRNYLKEYVCEINETKEFLQNAVPFYAKFKNISSFVALGLIGMGLVAIPFIFCGFAFMAIPLYFFFRQKKIESYLPSLTNHLNVVNDCINNIDNFLDEKYDVLKDFDEYKDNYKKMLLKRNNRYEIKKDETDEENVKDNINMNL